MRSFIFQSNIGTNFLLGFFKNPEWNPFDQEKRKFFAKKGSIETPIVDLINLTNSSDNYYTTRSFSGRAIIVIQVETLIVMEMEKLYLSL